MTDAWHQLSLEEQRRHEEEELKGDWDTWIAKEHTWWTYLDEWAQHTQRNKHELR